MKTITVVRVPVERAEEIADENGVLRWTPKPDALAEIERQIKRGVRRIEPLVYVVW